MAEPKRANSLVFNEALLKDFIDGSLEPAVESRVAKYLESKPELLERIAAKSGDGFLQRLRNIQQRSHAEAGQPMAHRLAAVATVRAASQPTAAKDSSVPAQLASYPGYKVTKELGRGGMGVVYLAKNIQMDRLEVLKVLNERLLDHAGAKERFLREIRAVSKLSHTNIVTSYSILQLDELMVFAMEYVPGIDLHQYTHKYKPMPVGLACSFAKQIAAGLQHAHEKGLVHRDIKPSNIIVYKSDGQLQLKILDFGLAKATSEEAANAGGLTQDGTMLGTPEYMSPEQSLNAAKADIRADIYSLGCTLYFMLTGKPPFTGTHGSLILAHAQQEPAALNLVRPEIPTELAAIVGKMMAKDVLKRYQTPSEVGKALTPFINQSPGVAGTFSQPAPASNTINDLNQPDRETSVAAPMSELDLAYLVQGIDAHWDPAKALPLHRPAHTFQYNQVRTKGKPQRPNWFVPTAIALGSLFILGLIWQLAAFTFRTPNGTIVVENLPADAEVLVDGKKFEIVWNKGKDKAEVTIDAGSHQLRVLNQGNEIFGDKVSVKGGDSTTVKLSVINANAPTTNDIAKPTAAAPIAVSPERPIDKVINDTSNGSDRIDWTQLFNGRDLTGWKQHPNSTGRWTVEQGEIVGRGVDQSHLFTQRDDFTDFHIRAEAKINAAGNSGICFRTSFFGKGQLRGNGYEANIEGDKAIAWQTGSIMHIDPNGQVVAQRVPPGEWFTLEVIAKDNLLIAKVNGAITARIEDPNRTYKRGHIALQQFHDMCEVRFRKIEILEDIPKTTTLREPNLDAWRPIFNGTDLTGWRGNTKLWWVRDGCITGRVTAADKLTSNTCLVWDGGELADFEIEFDGKISSGGNSGLQFRSRPADGNPFALKGYQADMNGPGTLTGILYEEQGRGVLANQCESTSLDSVGGKIAKSIGDPQKLRSTILASEWNHFRIVANGQRLQCYINSQLVSEVNDLDTGKAAQRGSLGFQLHTLNPTVQILEVQFKNVRLKTESHLLRTSR